MLIRMPVSADGANLEQRRVYGLARGFDAAFSLLAVAGLAWRSPCRTSSP